MAEKMLIIDDEEIVLKSCRKIFEAEGFAVVTTANPQEGLKLVSESTFDVILVDWMMPGFDRMDVVEEIDKRSPNSAVVMISGYSSVGRATEAMKRGRHGLCVQTLPAGGDHRGCQKGGAAQGDGGEESHRAIRELYEVLAVSGARIRG